VSYLPEGFDLALLVSLFGVSENHSIQGRTRIQKVTCVLKYRDDIPFGFDFKSYYYGPFSDDLAESIDRLVGLKILRETVVQVGYDTFRYDYQLTNAGLEIYEKVRRKLEHESPGLLRRISQSLRTIENLQTNDLVDLAKEESHLRSISPPFLMN
jgi:uncharacterized protein YwgA